MIFILETAKFNMNNIAKCAVISFSLLMLVLVTYTLILPVYGAAEVTRDLSEATQKLQNILSQTNSTSTSNSTSSNGTSTSNSTSR
jgi:hypothetical protein